MAITKVSNSGFKSGMTKYDSFLAGNAAYDPAATWLIQRVAGTGSSGSITFSSIPSTYKHLQIRGNVIPSTANGTQQVTIQINGATSTYTMHYLSGNGTSTGAGSGNGLTYIPTMAQSSIGSATYPIPFIIDIHDYASTTKNKVTRHLIGQDSNNTGAVAGSIELSSGMLISTSAVTSVTINMLNANFTTSSTIALYGMMG